jgi:hypothetical protein
MRTYREPARVKEHHTEEEHTPTVREGTPRERGRHSAQRSVHSDDDDIVAECWAIFYQRPHYSNLFASESRPFWVFSPTITCAAASGRQLRQPLSTNFTKLCALRARLACAGSAFSLAQGLMRILMQNCSFE